MYPKKKIISIVPYFSGYDKSLAKREPATTENRLEQFKLTIKNLKRYIEDIYVFTCSEYDKKKLNNLTKTNTSKHLMLIAILFFCPMNQLPLQKK